MCKKSLLNIFSINELKMTYNILKDIPGLGSQIIDQLHSGNYPGIPRPVQYVTDLSELEIEYLPDEARLTIQYGIKMQYTRDEVDSVINGFIKPWCKKYCKKSMVCGSYRRGEQLLKDIDLLVIANNAKITPSNNLIVIRNGNNRSKLFVKTVDQFVPLDIMYTEPKYWIFALLHFTGSKNFNIQLRKSAKERGLKLNEYGLFKSNGDRIEFKDESDVIKYLTGKNYKPFERSK